MTHLVEVSPKDVHIAQVRGVNRLLQLNQHSFGTVSQGRYCLIDHSGRWSYGCFSWLIWYGFSSISTSTNLGKSNSLFYNFLKPSRNLDLSYTSNDRKYNRHLDFEEAPVCISKHCGHNFSLRRAFLHSDKALSSENSEALPSPTAFTLQRCQLAGLKKNQLILQRPKHMFQPARPLWIGCDDLIFIFVEKQTISTFLRLSSSETETWHRAFIQKSAINISTGAVQRSIFRHGDECGGWFYIGSWEGLPTLHITHRMHGKYSLVCFQLSCRLFFELVGISDSQDPNTDTSSHC